MQRAAGWGRQSCLQAAFQAAIDAEQTAHVVRTYFCLAGIVQQRRDKVGGE